MFYPGNNKYDRGDSNSVFYSGNDFEALINKFINKENKIPKSKALK